MRTALPSMRGHGGTEGERGHSAGRKEVVRDLTEIQDHLAYRMPDAPKVLPHAEAMKENIATALGIATSQVGIKATTNEMMGFVGRREGMAAMAMATVEVS